VGAAGRQGAPAMLTNGGGRWDSNPDPVARSEAQDNPQLVGPRPGGNPIAGKVVSKGIRSPRLPVPPRPPGCPAPAWPGGDAVVPVLGRRLSPAPTVRPSSSFWTAAASIPVSLSAGESLSAVRFISQQKNEAPRGPGRSSRTIQSCAQESGCSLLEVGVRRPDRRPAAAHRAV